MALRQSLSRILFQTKFFISKKMSTTVSPDVAYVVKQLDEIRRDGHKRKHDLHVEFAEDEPIDGSNRFTKEETQTQPTVEVNNVDDTTYRTLIMIDPDAPSRDDPVKGPVLHWLVANFQDKSIQDGRVLYSYKGPGPPAGSGTHRYIFLLYQSIDKIQEKKIENEHRLRFPLSKFVTDNRLGLLDATYFTVDG